MTAIFRFAAEAEQLFLGQVGVQLHLQDAGCDLGIGEQIAQQGDVEVAYADVSHEAGADQVFHGLPCFADRHTGLFGAGVGRIRVVEPAGWIALFEWDVFQCEREVDQVQVEVLELQVAQ